MDEREIFKICLEHWTKLVAELYGEFIAVPNLSEMPLLNISPMGGLPNRNPGSGLPLRKHMYSEILTRLRVVMIETMAKPEEV